MNYEKKAMEVAYRILTKKDFEWSDEFSQEMKIEFFELLLKFFTDIEHYEKCAKIVKLQKQNMENMNENISKTNFTGSGIS